jgi:hypothetical protein
MLIDNAPAQKRMKSPMKLPTPDSLSFVQRDAQWSGRFACGFEMNATPGLHYISWGIASSILRLPLSTDGETRFEQR